MMSNLERLVYMANQIARNFIALGDDNAVTATADHIATFWDPRMKAQILEVWKNNRSTLQPAAAKAIALLAAKGAPAPTNRATEFDGAADAG